jgi:glyoxylase-like metal-dependent hydrolase (beta-lactamase superfamily II)
MHPPVVIVRDWLNANHVLFTGEENVLVDAGHVTGTARTLEALGEALQGRPLHRLVNTHCHSDHMGGNAAVGRATGCRIAIPEGEAPAVAAWDERALWLSWAGQQAERFAFDAIIRPGERLRLGDALWEALPAPGHDDGALMFWEPVSRTLISGDALWERGFGLVLPGEGWRERLARARATVLAIRALAPARVIPGHGTPFTAVEAAIDASLSRIAALEHDEARLARQVLKAMFAFTLLERGRLEVAAVERLVRTVPFYADVAPRAGITLEELAGWLGGELVRSRAARFEGTALEAQPG